MLACSIRSSRGRVGFEFTFLLLKSGRLSVNSQCRRGRLTNRDFPDHKSRIRHKQGPDSIGRARKCTGSPALNERAHTGSLRVEPAARFSSIRSILRSACREAFFNFPIIPATWRCSSHRGIRRLTSLSIRAVPLVARPEKSPQNRTSRRRTR